MNQYISNPEEVKDFNPRFRKLYIIIAFTFLIFTSRLWYLQIFSGSELRDFSEKNRIKKMKIYAPRGQILDRDGNILVENLPGFEAVISPQYIQDMDELAKNISPIINTEPDKIIQKIIKSKKQNGPYTPIKIKENLSREEVVRLKRIRMETPGLEIQESIVRHYPLNENGAQLFGYVGEISKSQIKKMNNKLNTNFYEQGDITGKFGLEESLESYIRGTDGISYIQVDAHGRETSTQSKNVYGEQIKNLLPQPGNNIILTLDRDVQIAAFEAMNKLKRIGAVVAMKSNGEILAWLSSPSFDPNEFSKGISSQTWSALVNDPFKPLRNKASQDFHSPGSTFKPFIALAALEEKVVTPSTIVSAPGVFYFGRRPYHDHLKGGHGNITIFDALERSSNVFFYKMGIALGIDKMFNYISPLGIGRKTGIDISREAIGRMPNADWKKSELGEEWQPGENLSTAIGQGFTDVTLLQMTVAYNTIGMEGKVVKPFVIKKVLDEEDKPIIEKMPSIERDLTQIQDTGVSISPSTFKIVKEGMRRVANGNAGTARFWKIPGVQMAGKTGTAQVMSFTADQIYANCETRPIEKRHHGWYIAFAPAQNPEITVGVLAEHSCHGNVGAAPIVRDVIHAYFKKYHPDIIAEGMKSKLKAEANRQRDDTPVTLEGE